MTHNIQAKITGFINILGGKNSKKLLFFIVKHAGNLKLLLSILVRWSLLILTNMS